MNATRLVILFLSAALANIAVSQTLQNPAYVAETFATGVAAPVTMVCVGNEEFFVCEKVTGLVKHRLRGEWLADLIDLNVASSAELGLLGICVDPDFPVTPYVYLFYSSAPFDGGEWTEDRVDKFILIGSRLQFVQTVFRAPYDPNQTNGASHHGGVIGIGSDRKLFVCYGDLGRGRLGDPRVETNTGMKSGCGAGAIYRVNLDGTTPLDNPFAFSPIAELQKVWVFGVRNSFGLSFDPYSSGIWFTENGPDVYDELNLGFSGMNSGWLKITGPDNRDATYFENEHHAYDADELSNIPGSQYSDPKFSWRSTIAPTAIAFPASDKFLPDDRRSMLVADANYGQIYAFTLNLNRDKIIYQIGTQDQVADNDTERDSYLFGSGFGLISDLKLGQDGYLYVVDLAGGRIQRIRPAQEMLELDTATVRRGINVGGSLTSFAFSDDERYVMENGFTPGGRAESVSVELTAHAGTAMFKTLQIVIESSAADSDLLQTVEIYDAASNEWLLADSRVLSETETLAEIHLIGIARRFFDAETGTIRARVTATPTAGSLRPLWRWAADRFAFKAGA